MSGHSKWSTIKHQKAVADKRRGQLFSKLTRVVSLAAREGPDPEKNFKLRLAIEKAKEANVPGANIERAIRSAQGKLDKGGLEEVVYEGYGPGKIAVVVEAVTDNRNRTTAEIKNLFEKSGGSLGGPGSVAYLFEKVGQVLIQKPKDSQEALLRIIDLGVENVEETEAGIEVFTLSGELEAMAQALGKAGFLVKSKDLIMNPKTVIEVKDRVKKEKILKFMEAIDEHDDVQKVFANFDLVD